MKTQIRGIQIDPGCEPVITKLHCTQTGLQGLLGGTLLCRRLPHEFAALLYREYGPANCLPNRVYCGRRYYGRLFIIGWRGHSPTDLTLDLAQTLAERWSRPEIEERPAGQALAAAGAGGR